MLSSDTNVHITSLHDLKQPMQAKSAAHWGVPDWLKQVNQDIDVALSQGASMRQLVKARANAMDSLLVALFELYKLDSTEMALFAVGGYGRGELSLYSDVDIVLLSAKEMDEETKVKINQFVAKLWDINIDPALAVRSVDECLQDASDHTIATALLESRLLAGNQALIDVPKQIVNETWSQNDFYQAKIEEARARYLQHNMTEYNLEPDIKNAPGGLRDIHVIGWVSKRYFRVSKLYDLVQQEFLTEKEFDELIEAENFLWTIRHHLHTITGRGENRLLFDHQREVAKRMGYASNPVEGQPEEHGNAMVERFMRDYYRCAMQISTLAEMLTNHYYETLIETRLPDATQAEEQPIDSHFNRIGDQIAIAHHRVFAEHPEAILKMFLLMGQHGIKRVRTLTLRALKIAVRGIDQAYRDNPQHKQLFMANIKEQNYLFHRLRTMSRYGVLGRYLPAFGQVVGLMQYDLFHRYTVDAHTLLLIRFLHRFTNDAYQDQFSLVSSIYQHIDRKDILSLAAIFHDIAKGRGGDHSELGETDAIEFCVAHGLSDADAKLVGWLTRHHLLMSITAQKQDISDPDVVANFASIVGNMTHLNHLYVLTVADMNATNSQLWNSWRATLMKQLYSSTRRFLSADVDTPTDRDSIIAKNREQAISMLHGLQESGLRGDSQENASQDGDLQADYIHQEEVLALWHELGDEYFLREVPSDIVWHTQAILRHQHNPLAQAADAGSEPLIVLREHRDLTLDAVQVFIYTQDQENLFAVTTAVFNQMNLDVLDARVITGTRDFALDSYVVLDRHGTLLQEKERQEALTYRLKHAFKNPTRPKITNQRLPRRLRHFNVPTKVKFEKHSAYNHHIMRVVALDQPGLLAQIGQIFLTHHIEVHFARITTLGERAEDLFFISDKQDKRLSDEKLQALKDSLIAALD